MNGKYWIQGKYTGRYFINAFGNRLEIYWADAVQLVNDHPEFEMVEVDDSYTPKEVKLSGPDEIQLDLFTALEGING